MLKYAIILLSNSATSFCYAENKSEDTSLMPLDTLRDVILWCMKENLRIQFVYPDFELPKEYKDVIDTIDHADIKHLSDADVIVINGISEARTFSSEGKSIVLRLSDEELFNNLDTLKNLMRMSSHLSIILKDNGIIKREDFPKYKLFLEGLKDTFEQLVIDGIAPQINILTDRLVLDKMNNCNAGVESITIAPNGSFYICPSFYFEDTNDSVGNLQDGLNIKNPQLLALSHAPICKICDAYHCRRCVWLNKKTTLEVNTPSREQCVMAHLERNASKELLEKIRKYGDFLSDKEIAKIDYLDPFDKIVNGK